MLYEPLPRKRRLPGRSHLAFPIEDYLCLTLYAASRAVTGLYRELLDELGLTYPQLWQRGPCLVKDVAATLQLDYGTLSQLLKRLEGAGLIRRAQGPHRIGEPGCRGPAGRRAPITGDACATCGA